jgi:hypothetical protein
MVRSVETREEDDERAAKTVPGSLLHVPLPAGRITRQYFDSPIGEWTYLKVLQQHRQRPRYSVYLGQPVFRHNRHPELVAVGLLTRPFEVVEHQAGRSVRWTNGG